MIKLTAATKNKNLRFKRGKRVFVLRIAVYANLVKKKF